jgi:competence ComEA-like helix-hairpin-helix protein
VFVLSFCRHGGTLPNCPLLLASLLCSALTCAATTKKPLAKPVNINTATSEQLQTVPGIGPATADKILQMRKSYGSFKSDDDLLAIRGIGPKRLDKMRKYLTIGKLAPASNKPKTVPAKTPSKTEKPDPEKSKDEKTDPPSPR